MRGWLILALAAMPSPARAADLLDDTFNGATLATTQNGGTFTMGGWSPDGGQAQLIYDLGREIIEGSCTVTVTRFDPANQISADKHHIVSMYTGQPGNHHDADGRGDAWWNVRVGTGYSDGPGMAGFKFLATDAAFANRQEDRLIQSRRWPNPSAVYELRVEWGGRQIRYLLDGQELISFQLAGPMRVRYLLIGKDDTYVGYAGPIYQRVRVTVPGAPDAGFLDAAASDAVAPDAGFLDAAASDAVAPDPDAGFAPADRGPRRDAVAVLDTGTPLDSGAQADGSIDASRVADDSVDVSGSIGGHCACSDAEPGRGAPGTIVFLMVAALLRAYRRPIQIYKR